MASFSDDFNRPDSSDLGPGWVEVSGDWSIIGGQLAPDTSSGNTILRAATPMASSDNYAQCTIVTSIAASQGVWCRGGSTLSSGYLWRTNGSSWDLFAVVSGSFGMIGTYAVAVAPGDVAKVQAVGNVIKGFVNGVERVSVVNTDVPAGVNVGLRVMAVGGLRFDDFAAADVTAGVALGSAAATDAAQALSGGKAAPLSAAVAVDAAQTVAGAKVGAPSPAAAVDTVQALAGSKTAVLAPAVEPAAAQPLTAVKAAALGPAQAIELVQAFAGGKRATLTPSASREQALPVTGSGPLPSGPDIDVTVGRPYSSWSADVPHGSGWEVGEPC
ncbi:hypothetical protein [Streptomyces sp.]|uniref:hypothetical protein n=1 Tax=Streptomyces sp. TaxID=1931 RepID=UPI002810ACC6|nr:hypothetical protein [Streptomyces sp.]